jgi:hypothetical protein
MAEAGWYRDPAGEPHLRYFDGERWTEQVRPYAAPVGPPIDAVASPADRASPRARQSPRRMLAVGIAALVTLGGAGLAFASLSGDGESPEPSAEPLALAATTPQSELVPEAKQEPEAEPPANLEEVVWEEQDWTTTCVESGEPSSVTLTPGTAPGELWSNADGPSTAMNFTVELDRTIFGDVTGDDLPDAIFATNCFLGNDFEFYVEVWSHDPDGRPVQLPPVVAYTKWDGSIDEIEIVDGSLHIHTSEPAPGDDAPHLNGYPVLVVTAWQFHGQGWIAEELSSTDTTPPAPEPAPEPEPTPEPEPDPTPESTQPAPPGPAISGGIAACTDAEASSEAAARCLVAAVNAQDYETANSVALDGVVAELRELRQAGTIEWDFNGCDATSCWFYEHSPDPQWHGVIVEMWMGYRGDAPVVETIDFYG